MLKYAFSLLCLSCITATSFAYTIGQELTVTNNTSTDMKITIDKLNRQAAVIRIIPAHTTATIYTENGDNSGNLYQYAKAPFRISHLTNGTQYVKGRLSFYVGGSYQRKFSFLNSVSASEGLKLNTSYSCAVANNGTVFQNKIVLDGTPLTAAPDLQSDKRKCVGLISSKLDQGYDFYTSICSTQRPLTFFKNYCRAEFGGDDVVNQVKCLWISPSWDFEVIVFKGKIADDIYRNQLGDETLKLMKEVLDEKLGRKYCHNTSF